MCLCCVYVQYVCVGIVSVSLCVSVHSSYFLDNFLTFGGLNVDSHTLGGIRRGKKRGGGEE